MSLSVSILASGSSGNCALLRGREGIVLIDCGIGPRTAAGRMKELGVGITDVLAVCLTHLDRDHFNPVWIDTLIKKGIRVFCHESRMDDLARIGDGSAEFARLLRPFNGHVFSPTEAMKFAAIRLAHDACGSHGFLVDSHGSRLGYATDLGRATGQLIRYFQGVDVLAIESNYDPQMQMNSGRPWFLKQRIMGGHGHLSNADALAAVREILNQSQGAGRRLPKHIILLHRSRECNCPRLLRELFSSDERIGGRLVLAEQDQATPWLCAGERDMVRQLELQWS
jgi:phosphoribosyl 1,2-cyclic phosphodiesterase